MHEDERDYVPRFLHSCHYEDQRWDFVTERHGFFLLESVMSLLHLSPKDASSSADGFKGMVKGGACYIGTGSRILH